MKQAIKSVVIVGGGTAGWITAGRIAAENSSNQDTGVKVTLIESANISPVGVGEGTWPTMRTTLQKLGISESDFIRQCDASFKQGAKFARWLDGSEQDYYYHPLMLPQGFGKTNLAPYWSARKQQLGKSFSESVCFQEAICEHGLAPKTIRSAEFSGVANYAYHLDAGKFSVFLQKHCIEKLGVKHVLDDVIQVNSAANGDIASVTGKLHGEVSGDLFVDCSGFASLLLGEHFKIPFVDCSDVLFIDTALPVQVPYAAANSPISSHTIATAQEAGWIWDIGLQHRRGVGYAYASKYCSEQQARATLASYLGINEAQLVADKIPIRSGHRATFWHRNCVAVGLSAGFLEPLEASALVLVELSAQFIAEQLPACREVMDVLAKRFNETFSYRWQRIIDFLKLHYVLSRRKDSQFWIDNRDPSTIPASLQDLLSLWRFHPPGDLDFTSNNEVFPAASYQYVLYGMGFETDTSLQAHKLSEQQLAEQQFAINQKNIDQVLASLPGNRELLEKVHQYGFQAV
jgi:tryptophan 7-halogenase